MQQRKFLGKNISPVPLKNIPPFPLPFGGALHLVVFDSARAGEPGLGEGWNITIQIEKAQKVLRVMYLSLNIKDKEFADKFLLFDLINLKGNVDTGLPLDIIFNSKFKN